MLFSNKDVAAFINARFEPAWESVRAVPIVRIDFGNGTVLTRTLNGNILTSVCDAEGRVLDALPGIYEAATFRDQLNQLRLLGQYAMRQPAEKRAEWVKKYHDERAAKLAKGEKPERLVDIDLMITKSRIERPVADVLAGGPNANTKTDGKAGTDVAGWKELAEDTKLNETTRRRQIHEMLRDAGLVRPGKVVKPIYKDVLHADLDDPYLGLGKILFATYPFAKEDAAGH